MSGVLAPGWRGIRMVVESGVCGSDQRLAWRITCAPTSRILVLPGRCQSEDPPNTGAGPFRLSIQLRGERRLRCTTTRHYQSSCENALLNLARGQWCVGTHYVDRGVQKRGHWFLDVACTTRSNHRGVLSPAEGRATLVMLAIPTWESLWLPQPGRPEANVAGEFGPAVHGVWPTCRLMIGTESALRTKFGKEPVTLCHRRSSDRRAHSRLMALRTGSLTDLLWQPIMDDLRTAALRDLLVIGHAQSAE